MTSSRTKSWNKCKDLNLESQSGISWKNSLFYSQHSGEQVNPFFSLHSRLSLLPRYPALEKHQFSKCFHAMECFRFFDGNEAKIIDSDLHSSLNGTTSPLVK
ncbi:MAG: hypothetical protein ACTSVI_04260 [Promethearchaeota archaeon]